MRFHAGLVFLIFCHALTSFASPCLEAYKRVAISNAEMARNDELIALQMLYAEADLENIKSESFFFLKNAVADLSRRKKIETNFQELQAHIYAGFARGEFCDKNTMPKKSAGQIIRIAKSEVRDARETEQDIKKEVMPKSFSPGALADSLRPNSPGRKPASGDFKQQ